MCLAVPVRILSIDGDQGVVEIGGMEHTISLLLTPEACVGDYVLLHTGFAIQRLDREEAEESLRLFAEMAALAAEMERSAGGERATDEENA
ncbi:MAG: HypC/HybG/HupF family hydrogenase formation chaperone [Chloroflexi bacterium]|jgi:hydrogenase expression/formation protein HypC|nr:HypC/HybG/HupF family hydrogenase formation chaperone [Chloroflexota bacterium]